MKVNITIDENRQKSHLDFNQTLNFSNTFLFYTILGFIQSYSGLLGDIENLIQILPGEYKSSKPFKITGVDKVHLKGDCIR